MVVGSSVGGEADITIAHVTDNIELFLFVLRGDAGAGPTRLQAEFPEGNGRAEEARMGAAARCIA